MIKFSSFILMMLLSYHTFSQGLPPGWDIVITPSSHIIAVPLGANPTIDGIPINPGDYIGVFYMVDGSQACGGALEWNGNSNIAVYSRGDDNYTPIKDGFSYSEIFNWRLYSWSEERDYEAFATYDLTFPNDSTFMDGGLSNNTDISAIGLDVTLSADPDTICEGESSNLYSVPIGGTSQYFYSWSSNPAGFSSTDQNPIVSPTITTTYYLKLNNYADTIIDSVKVNVIPIAPVNLFLQNQIINGADWFAASRIIAGSEVTDPPFGLVVINSGADVTFKAQDSIVLKHGFRAVYGCDFHAFIGTVPCLQPADTHPQNNNATNTKWERNEISGFKTFIANNQISVWPNPTNRFITIGIDNKSNIIYNVAIVNLCGNIIFNQENIRENEYSIDLGNNSPGIYIVRIMYKDEIYFGKIMLL